MTVFDFIKRFGTLKGLLFFGLFLLLIFISNNIVTFYLDLRTAQREAVARKADAKRAEDEKLHRQRLAAIQQAYEEKHNTRIAETLEEIRDIQKKTMNAQRQADFEKQKDTETDIKKHEDAGTDIKQQEDTETDIKQQENTETDIKQQEDTGTDIEKHESTHSDDLTKTPNEVNKPKEPAKSPQSATKIASLNIPETLQNNDLKQIIIEQQNTNDTQDQTNTPSNQAIAPEDIKNKVIFEKESFSMCGYDNFMITIGNSKLQLENKDRKFPFRDGFRNWNISIPLSKEVEAFLGCKVLFNVREQQGLKYVMLTSVKY